MANLAKVTIAPKYDFLELEADEGTDGVELQQQQQQEPCLNDLTNAMQSRHHPTVAAKTSGRYSSTSTDLSFRVPNRKKKKTPYNYRTPQATSSSVRRSNLSSTTPRSLRPTVIVAIVEGRGCARGEIGMASLDLISPKLILSQFSDSQMYDKVIMKLNILRPLEIIMPSTAFDNTNTMKRLAGVLSNFFPNASIINVQRRYFNETKGLQYVRHLKIHDCETVEIEVATKYYCLACAAALLKYVEFIQNILFARNSLKVIFTGGENTTMIDTHTADVLELVTNMKDSKSEHTLYGVLHATKTFGGSRLLRANILQPPCDLKTIYERQECVSELLGREDMFFSLQTVLRRFLDIEHLLSMCIQIPKQETLKSADNKLTYVIYLKHTLELIEPLKASLQNCECDLLKTCQKSLDDPRYCKILEKIHGVILNDTKFQAGSLNMRAQKCFAVKPNINGLLDVARRTYAEIVDDISRMVNQLSETHNLPLQTVYNVGRGFYIQINCSGKNSVILEHLPPVFIKKSKAKNRIRCTTLDLIKLNGRVDESLSEIFLMSNVIVTELLMDIITDIGCLHKLIEVVSTLDMLTGFAQVCTLSKYIRPEFTDTLAIKCGRHPILERISPELPVPNNTYLTEGSNFAIITGPNMSGKSTYLKQVALMQIMAQIGCFVPAEYASFRLINHLFSRKGSGDDIETNSSTFMVEMKEINYILRMASDSSLIIIDELGRGTSVEEGIGLCYAVCEELLHMKVVVAFTLFTTHFMELTYLDCRYPNACNYHFNVGHIQSECSDAIRLVFSYAIRDGPTDERNYGLKLAELTTLPDAIVKDASSISSQASEQFQANNPQKKEDVKRRAVFQLATRLAQAAKNSTVKMDALLPYLSALKVHYHQTIAQLTVEE